MASRRRLLGKLAGAAAAAGLAGCSQFRATGGRATELDLPENPHDVPRRQHAWNAASRTDRHGNPLLPRHHLVLLLDLAESPSVESAERVERAMRTLESAYEWSSDGLLHSLAWGTRYFERLGNLGDAPIRRPQVLSRTDDPELLDFDAALVLASDAASNLRAAEAATFGNRDALAGETVGDRLGDVFDVAARRTGFRGAGLPVEHTDAEGIPESPPLSKGDRMFMGFRSGFRGTQAGEDRVTIDSGAYAGGTTMHLSHLRQSLGRWFEAFDDDERVARMFSPEFSPADVANFTDDVPFGDEVARHAREFDVVGHQEKVAQTRKDGEPVLLRRDFNTVDGGHAGVHFLSLQQSLSDFERTRKAMNGWYVRDDSPEITDRKNNGILDFVSVRSRANFYVPPRGKRAFPRL
ncbi:hypothetical protein M0R89_14610 [Halorussus limi]|uniref:Tat pathway signal protein n=1 Tax=Halorussus limi TaxID=2938695 RepID=A0A8U0HRU1_9EURY|nr:hypothetical protein [Halorussus limi]UPV73765.1 hypothetical protein M0R89_14610 [Halorussus limi]